METTKKTDILSMKRILITALILISMVAANAQTVLDLDYQQSGRDLSIGLNTDKRVMISYRIANLCQLRLQHSVVFDSWKYQQYGLDANFRVLGTDSMKWGLYVSPFVSSDYRFSYAYAGVGLSANYKACKHFEISATLRYSYDTQAKHRFEYQGALVGRVNKIFALFAAYDNLPTFRYSDKSYLTIGALVTVKGLGVKPYVRTSVMSKSDLSMARFNIALVYNFDVRRKDKK